MVWLILFLFSFIWFKTLYIENGFASWDMSSSSFRIDPSNFSPGSNDVLKEVQKWTWNTEKTANIVLWLIIKNLIIVFWVFSLWIMTIWWWMMIFHIWQEWILSKWKWMFIWWIGSLVIALSAGLIVQLVSYFLY